MSLLSVRYGYINSAPEHLATRISQQMVHLGPIMLLAVMVGACKVIQKPGRKFYFVDVSELSLWKRGVNRYGTW